MERDFNKLQTTILGTKAEDLIINEFVLSKGYFPYTPSVSASHPIDCIMISGSSQVWLDVKCKSRRKFFSDTGADTIDIDNYLNAPFPVYLLWVCPIEKRVYGNFLKRLIPYRKDEKRITYFPLNKMQPFRDLTEAEYLELKELERSNYY